MGSTNLTQVILHKNLSPPVALPHQYTHNANLLNTCQESSLEHKHVGLPELAKYATKKYSKATTFSIQTMTQY